MNSKSKIVLIFLFTINQLISQERVVLKEIYYENSLAYKIVNSSLFTGIVHRNPDGADMNTQEC